MEITTFANLSNAKVNHPDSDFIFHFIYNFSRMTWLFFFIYFEPVKVNIRTAFG